MGNPGNLGGAQGRINIDISQLQAAQQQVQQASRQMTQALNQVSPAAASAQRGITDLSGGLRQLAQSYAVIQTVRFVADSNQLATAYNRQRVAAVSLAGSQEKLNELLETYERASGGSASQVAALADVTNLLTQGFADSSDELERFLRGVRGATVATGRGQEFIITRLQLELLNQTGQRLNEIGLQMEAVRARTQAVQAANRGLSNEQAYQIAVMDELLEKFGALADSAEGQKTGLEQLADAWEDFRLALGQVTSPSTNFLSDALSNWLRDATEHVYLLGDALQFVQKHLQAVGNFLAPGVFAATQSPEDAATAASANNAATIIQRFTQDQTDAVTDWFRQTQEIEAQANQQRIDATRQYEQQRSDTIRQYEQTIAREAQDFALSRARAEQDYGISLQRIRRDIAQREARQLEDLERTIADARGEAAERASQRQVELDERLAESRAESRSRIAELEADYNKRRERAARDHQETLADAAGRLDALTVSRQQREFAKRQRDEQEDFDERLSKERANEEKRLTELEKANAKQVASEQAALDKRIRQANDAYQRQLEDARAADEQRLSDMSADFALRQEREDADRALRLQRLAEDHQAQLEEQARQHEERLLQIARQEQDARDKLDEEFQKELAALGIRTQAYRDKLKGLEEAAIAAFDRVWAHWLGAMQGPQPLNPFVGQGGIPSLTSPSVAPRSVTNSRTTNAGVTFNIYATPNQQPYDIASEVNKQMERLLTEWGQ